ncbi:MAG: TetR/AcrR family transcriptional regulator [Deltaproteobacteria bacterium]|nr:MAG: TetR/AcrR family transcriptional regulator [Deltaproteobacteria bacterium]
MADASPAADLRTRLVACALSLLDHEHPDDLSIREVTRLAGASSGAPYHHFGDKRGLLAACADVAWRDLRQAMDGAADPTDDLVAQLRARALAYLAFALANPGQYRLLMSRLFDDAERFPNLVEQRAEAMRGVMLLIAHSGVAGNDALALKQRGLAIWSMLHGFAELALDGGWASEEGFDAKRVGVVDLAVRAALLPEEGA